MRIGVLALQGDFERHVRALERCGGPSAGAAAVTPPSARGPHPRHAVPAGPGGGAPGGAAVAPPDLEIIEVRQPEQLEGLDGLIIPGGESTTLLHLMNAYGFVPALEKFHAGGRPIFGTCAGLILLARQVDRPRQFSLGLLDVAVERNAYGRQRESFETPGVADLDGPVPIEMVFIRAPRICQAGPDVRVLARHGEEPVLVRQGSVLAGSFHPELTDSTAVHRYFCDMVRRAQ